MAVQDEVNENLVYETDDKGQQVIVRSINSLQPVHVRFVNTSARPVDVWWRDYQGIKRHYRRLDPGKFFDMDTFITHPWEFTDPATNENYVINNKRIFRAPKELANYRRRTLWRISVCVRSLRNTVLLSLADRLNDAAKVPALGLPRMLENDLLKLIEAMNDTPAPPQNS